MEPLITPGDAATDPVAAKRASRRLGFTFLELMIVMAVIAVLMAVALPIYTRTIKRSKESVLKNNI
jgi:general secretion pathway protein G